MSPKKGGLFHVGNTSEPTQGFSGDRPLVFSSGVDIAVQYGLDTSFGFIQTVCAIIGAVSVTGAAKRALFRGNGSETMGNPY